MSKKSPKMELKLDHPKMDAASLERSLSNHLVYSVSKDHYTATDRDWFYSSAYAVRERLTERWMETMRSYYDQDEKRVYYLSMEFLMGRTLMNAVLNMQCDTAYAEALEKLDLDIHHIREIEHDAALGNGGLGRLAACFLDSMATIGLPGVGYGIRYEYGMFTQKIEHGWQIEHPDNWLRYGNPWEFPRPEVLYQIQFEGRIVSHPDKQGDLRHYWIDTNDVMAMAYDTPIPGYDTDTVNNMRLWAAKASRDFELKYFNQGNYIKAVEDKNESENLSKVLYPDDTTEMGRELRLKQQYFFVSASIQDIIRRYCKDHEGFDNFPNKIAIQLNDTHPSIGVAELMRLLIDIYGLEWTKAWEVTTHTFSYTNHTLMPEALETWPISLFERILPRHLQIIYEINYRFLKQVSYSYPGDMDLLRRVSIIDEEGGRRIRMAHLAFVGSHKINGVARIHTELMKQTIFADFHRIWPDKIINMTNGVTPRRWLHQANPGLSLLITKHIGKDWCKDLDQLEKMLPLAENPEFRRDFDFVKRANKAYLAKIIKDRLQINLNPDSMFDVQVKRIHEYKRQLLNLLHVITRYNRIRANPGQYFVPRTIIIGGKAAPGYRLAKLIIKFIGSVADIINNDAAIGDKLKVVFIPNYDVSNAEIIIPAADLSEQISTAGTEASGTSNMKLSLNGALTIGTMDGANVEICEEVGPENIFIFGMTTEAVADRRQQGYDPWVHYHENDELRHALEMIQEGFFCPENRSLFHPIFDTLTHHGDHYMLLADYASYIKCQEDVDTLYQDQEQWTRKAILNVAKMGQFSSDRTIRQYMENIWHAKAAKR